MHRVNIYEHKFETFQLIALCGCTGTQFANDIDRS